MTKVFFINIENQETVSNDSLDYGIYEFVDSKYFNHRLISFGNGYFHVFAGYSNEITFTEEQLNEFLGNDTYEYSKYNISTEDAVNEVLRELRDDFLIGVWQNR